MKLLSLLKSRNESLEVDFGIENLKKILDADKKKFYFKWQTEKSFIISLNFSFGTNIVFDTNYHNTKSDIIAEGDLIVLNENRTKINLKTKSKYWLTLLLFAPLFMLTLDFWLNLGIPIPFYFIFPIGFIVVLNLINSEDKKLIRNFKEYLNLEINNALQHRI